jgi:hypothetical protein
MFTIPPIAWRETRNKDVDNDVEDTKVGCRRRRDGGPSNRPRCRLLRLDGGEQDAAAAPPGRKGTRGTGATKFTAAEEVALELGDRGYRKNRSIRGFRLLSYTGKP